ncbi:sulfur carrier protein ThiS [Luteolibacter sp. GHJ8]|uniref:Sulfur carrier protein ThiS n=1 Tax=Luteolibacter rhizosphaerae TaxID=2989719 RepID=A0ABT3G6K3_9BACT|nr:sulfur carrier protein ThiS [Luteolibacter rhizosphaerae]MCW1915460.1 sulfur carrier protein ThiS [Luteolibacter rhizosphaerae]
MTITLNGQPRGFDAATLTVEGLLAEVGLAGRPVVVEVDLEAVFPADYAGTALRDGSSVEIVTIAAGG